MKSGVIDDGVVIVRPVVESRWRIIVEASKKELLNLCVFDTAKIRSVEIVLREAFLRSSTPFSGRIHGVAVRHERLRS